MSSLSEKQHDLHDLSTTYLSPSSGHEDGIGAISKRSGSDQMMTISSSSTIGLGGELGLRVEHGLSTVYIQQTNGSFKSFKSADNSLFSVAASPSPHYITGCSVRTAVDIAIAVEKLWYFLSNFCFGILAGVAALHLIIMESTVPMWRKGDEGSERVVRVYSETAFILPLIFYICLALCLISLMDRLDMRESQREEETKRLSYRSTWFLLVLYLAVFLLHELSVKYDDIFILHQHNHFFLLSPHVLMGELEVWRWLDCCKCILSLMGWLVMSLVPGQDLLLHHLIYLKTYDLQPSDAP